mmetsp:Transcript_8800/g.22652  ORF Transcript_8800/g.22652 Transcript_8800/m.22652 type:complete len:320 (+) Transcript_8800:234-1193(+)
MDAASVVVDHLGSFSALIAEIVRLHDLIEAVDTQKPDKEPGNERGRGALNGTGQGAGVGMVPLVDSISTMDDLEGPVVLAVEKLTLKTPYVSSLASSMAPEPNGMGNESHRIGMVGDTQRVLTRNLNLQLTKGQSLLIIGPPGCGKSSLLRAIAGLWRFGSGEIHTISKRHTMFLPQKAYSSLGTLRDQLLYSQTWDEDVLFSDNDLCGALRTADLTHLMDLGGLDTKIDWTNILSVGESQKLAFARLFVKRPVCAFLDESTSAMSPEDETTLYTRVKCTCETFVSVGHRTSLIKYHTHLLKHARGTWQLIDRSRDFRP